MVRVGIEWVEKFHPNTQHCTQPDLRYSGHCAQVFLMAMRGHGHDDIFERWNDGALPTDFDHPDLGGDSINRIENVHFLCWAGHGGMAGFMGKRVHNIGFSSSAATNIAPCRSMTAQWKMGVKMLKWLLLDDCMTVENPSRNHVVEVWGPPMQGLHLLLGFIDLQMVGPGTYHRRINFVDAINYGWPLAIAWLDSAYHWDNPKKDQPTRPIAIAAGSTRDEAVNRRDHETLGWIYFDVKSTDWLAWRWRE